MIELIFGGAVVLLASVGASYYLIQNMRGGLKQDFSNRIDDVGMEQDSKRKKFEEQVREQILHDIQSIGTKEGELSQGLQEASSTLNSLVEKREEFKSRLSEEIKESLKDELRTQLNDVSSKLYRLKTDEELVDKKIDEESQELTQNIGDVQSRLVKIKDDETALMSKLEETANNLSKIFDDKKSLEEALKANLNEELAIEISQLRGQSTRIRNELTREKRKLKKDIGVAVDEINRLRRAKDELAQKLRRDFSNTLQSEKKELRTDIEELKSSRNKMKTDYDREIRKLRQDRGILESQIKKLGKSVRGIRR